MKNVTDISWFLPFYIYNFAEIHFFILLIEQSTMFDCRYMTIQLCVCVKLRVFSLDKVDYLNYIENSRIILSKNKKKTDK